MARAVNVAGPVDAKGLDATDGLRAHLFDGAEGEGVLVVDAAVEDEAVDAVAGSPSSATPG